MIRLIILILFCMLSVNAFAEREASSFDELKLLKAVSRNSTATPHLLLNDIAVDITDQYSRSLLILAVQHNNQQLVCLLIHKGANPNYKIESSTIPALVGMNVLDFAVKNNNVEMVNLLLKEGAKLDAKNKEWLDEKSKEKKSSKEKEEDKLKDFEPLVSVPYKDKKQDRERYERLVEEEVNRIAEQQQQEAKTRTKEWIVFFSCSLTLTVSLIYRKKLVIYGKQLLKSLVMLVPILCKRLISSLFTIIVIIFREIGLLIRGRISFSELYKRLIFTLKLIKNKIVSQLPLQSKIDNESKTQISPSDRGWAVDDTINLEVTYLTIEDIINPISMVNQHERIVREMIWYIRKVEKTNEDKQQVSDMLVSKWKQVNPTQVRSVYKRSLLIILENYSKQNSIVKQLIKQVKTKTK